MQSSGDLTPEDLYREHFVYLNKIGKPPNILKYIPEDKEKGIKQILILDEDPIEKGEDSIW